MGDKIPLSMREELLRKLPQVSKIVEHFRDRYNETYIKSAVREVLDRYRREILHGDRESIDNLLTDIELRIREISYFSLKKVINASGVIINTNLGRSPIHPQALEFLERVAIGYSNLEFNLDTGSRGHRNEHVEWLLCQLTGSESAFVVNNNAGAVYLVLNTLAKDREVILSRGELVEIGGSFRIPEIMESSGAILREVGTTNRTRISDYERAIGENTALLMKVHRSNFYMEGFVEEVSLRELVQLGKRYVLPTFYDSGSGLMVDLGEKGISSTEPTLKDCIDSGIDIVSASGDKLLGSAQAGIILGRRELIERVKKNPMSRALRIDKLCLGVLEFTLRLYLEGREEEIPIIAMLLQKPDVIKARAYRLLSFIGVIPGIEAEVIREFSRPGGGSLPELKLETYCVAVRHKDLSPDKLSEKLRGLEIPIIGRIKDERLLLDMRTVSDEEVLIIDRSFRALFLQG